MESSTVVGKYVCDIPLFFGDLKYFSHGIGITASVLTYYMFSAFYTGSAFESNSYGWSVFATLLVVVFLQAGSLSIQNTYGKCTVSPLGSVLSLLIGFAIGGGTFGILKATAPQYLPYSSLPENFTNLSLGEVFGKPAQPSLVKSDAKKDGPDVQQSHKMDDSDEFVCDLYKNGQLITTTVSE